MIRIVHIRALGGWFIVRGPHWAPIGGRFPSKAAAQAWLKAGPDRRRRRPRK